MIFNQNKPQLFTVGSIIHKASELPADTQLTFFLFKVVIGRAYCHKGSTPPPTCPEGYDSVYLENENMESSSVFSHNYLIYNFERTQLIHQVTTRIKVDPVKAYSETSTCDSCGEQ
jgi:hypothetical protein